MLDLPCGIGLVPVSHKGGRFVCREGGHFRCRGGVIIRDGLHGLQKWMSLAGNRVVHPTLVYGGADTLTYQEIRVLGWGQVPTLYPVFP